MLPLYLEHLNARLKARQTKNRDELATLPESIATLCSSEPSACLAMIVEALEHVHSPDLIREIGEGLLADLLNERAAAIEKEVTSLLWSNPTFRQAFACGNHASVDPDLVDDWMKIFQDLGTTKATERKRLWSPSRK